EVGPGEGRHAGQMLLAVFLVLGSYYFVKPVRDGLLAATGVEGLSRVELKASAVFAQSLLLAGLIPLYARLAGRLSRRALLTGVNLFFVASLLVFWLLQPGLLVERVPFLGVAFYLWVGVFNAGVIAQFWSFTTDVYGGRGKRLIPVIAVGASAGAVAGAWAVQSLVSAGALRTYSLLPVGAVLLLVATVLLRRVEENTKTRAGSEPRAAAGDAGALDLVLGHRYLLATAAFVLILNWVGTTGENVLFGVVQQAVARAVDERGIVDPAAIERTIADETTAFYGSFFFWTNLAALLLQTLLVSRVVRYGGFGTAFLLLPVVAMFSYLTMALVPVLAAVRLMKIAENAIAYSVGNTANQILWLPATREMKYKAKAAIDTIFVRAGDALGALTVLIGTYALGLPLRSLYVVNVLLIGASLLVGGIVVRERRRLARRPAAASGEPFDLAA
ncbi:MAG: hypothetical protein ACREQY_04475, partial [Candidatus Binatia bacterium]